MPWYVDRRRQRAKLGSLMVGGLLLLGGCVDPEERYGAFLERTAEMRNRDSGPIEPTDRFDWSGRYLLALSTVLAPDQPLLFAVDAEVSSDLTTADLELQPLTTDDDDEPRTAVGESFRLNDIAYDKEGTFSADLGEVAVPGRANPITGADIVAQVQLVARTRAASADEDGFFCGEVSGMVVRPLTYDLAGSTFGAVLAEQPEDATPLLRCPP
jgi:hypothetical protein